jgi:TRAP-type C4-dicarboxylate transport system permease small subunit
MAKRTKGKGSERKRAGAMTRRDREAKMRRRAERSQTDPPPASDDDAADERRDEPDEPDEARARPPAADSEPPASDPEPDPEPPEREEPDDEPPSRRRRSSAPPSRAEEGADWALPILRFDAAWTRFEERAIVVVLGVLTLVLCFWAGMKSMSEAVASPIAAGTAFRALFGAVALGLGARLATRGRDEKARTWITVGAIAAGVLVAPLWRGVGINFFGGLLEWLQKGSFVNLFGGLKGVSTRLAVLVALIGGSLACATGSHIAIDVVVRFVPVSTRRPIAIASTLATVLVCTLAAWGFFDHVAITRMAAPADAPASEKFSAVAHQAGNQFFLLRKQLKLDLAALPYVFASEKWNAPERLDGAGWNAFLDEEGFAEHFDISKLRADGAALEQPYEPNVGIPAFRVNPKMHITAVDLMWPIGFLVMAFRLLMRAALMGARQVKLQLEGEADDDEAAEEAA